MKTEKPTVEKTKSFGDDTEVRKHPAFGQIHASRITGTTDLYGSNIRHSGFIEIRVSGSHEEIRNGKRYYYNGPEEISLWLSEAAWASLISSLNMGTGVPCTIRSKHSGKYTQLPEIEGEPYSMKRDQEIALAVDRRARQLKEAVAFFDQIMASGSPKKADLKQFRSMLTQPVDNLRANVEFESNILMEHSEDLVQEARAEIEAYITRVAMQFPGLTSGAPVLPQIEKKEADND